MRRSCAAGILEGLARTWLRLRGGEIEDQFMGLIEQPIKAFNWLFTYPQMSLERLTLFMTESNFQITFCGNINVYGFKL